MQVIKQAGAGVDVTTLEGIGSYGVRVEIKTRRGVVAVCLNHKEAACLVRAIITEEAERINRGMAQHLADTSEPA